MSSTPSLQVTSQQPLEQSQTPSLFRNSSTCHYITMYRNISVMVTLHQKDVVAATKAAMAIVVSMHYGIEIHIGIWSNTLVSLFPITEPIGRR